MFRRVATLAKITLQESLRKKPLIILFVASLIFISSAQLSSLLISGIPVKKMQAVWLRSLIGFSTLLAVYLGACLLFTREGKKKLYSLLSLPVRRGEIVIGKFIGGAIALLFLLLLMGVVFIAVTGLKQFSYLLIWQAILLAFWEILLIFSLSLMLSTLVTPLLNISISLFVSLASNISVFLKALSSQVDNALLSFLVKILYYFIPHLNRFDITSNMIAGEGVTFSLVLKNLAYGFYYMALFLTIGIILFAKKEL
ncbi:MAG: ABC transporter permease [Caldiserica bacterium]|nr:ABC transporter permease [Caldisericota bacterium]